MPKRNAEFSDLVVTVDGLVLKDRHGAAGVWLPKGEIVRRNDAGEQVYIVLKPAR